MKRHGKSKFRQKYVTGTPTDFDIQSLTTRIEELTEDKYRLETEKSRSKTGHERYRGTRRGLSHAEYKVLFKYLERVKRFYEPGECRTLCEEFIEFIQRHKELWPENQENLPREDLATTTWDREQRERDDELERRELAMDYALTAGYEPLVCE